MEKDWVKKVAREVALENLEHDVTKIYFTFKEKKG